LRAAILRAEASGEERAMEAWFVGRVAFVTGAGDGIGRAGALLFARRGARVVATDVRGDAAAATAGLIVQRGGEAIGLACDVTDDASVAGAIAATVDRYGGLHHAFNNAGVTLPGDDRWDEAVARRTMDVNLFGVMNCLRHQVPRILASGGGAIVNTASLAGFVTSRAIANPAYSASKHGVIGLTKVAAIQNAAKGLRVNAICPGATMTTMVREVMDSAPEARRTLEQLSPMGRVAEPEEMAEAAVWLCSDMASFVNAHALVLDGGALAE
jgi:NAD(P)-dependent dehydrogenase (short-subunit alcohol dehydrogenase family)